MWIGRRPTSVSSLVTFHLVFWDRISQLTGNLPVWSQWLTRVLSGILVLALQCWDSRHRVPCADSFPFYSTTLGTWTPVLKLACPVHCWPGLSCLSSSYFPFTSNSNSSFPGDRRSCFTWGVTYEGEELQDWPQELFYVTVILPDSSSSHSSLLWGH